MTTQNTSAAADKRRCINTSECCDPCKGMCYKQTIAKGTVLMVRHSRKGTFMGMAMRDFVPDNETFYPIVLAQETPIDGLKTIAKWKQGEEVPCRDSLCHIIINYPGYRCRG